MSVPPTYSRSQKVGIEPCSDPKTNERRKTRINHPTWSPRSIFQLLESTVNLHPQVPNPCRVVLIRSCTLKVLVLGAFGVHFPEPFETRKFGLSPTHGCQRPRLKRDAWNITVPQLQNLSNKRVPSASLSHTRTSPRGLSLSCPYSQSKDLKGKDHVLLPTILHSGPCSSYSRSERFTSD